MSRKSRDQKKRANAASTSQAAPPIAATTPLAAAVASRPSLGKAAKRREQKKRAAKAAAKAATAATAVCSSTTPVGLGGKKRATPAPAATLQVIYEDEAVLAVNKPAGLLCHPSPGFWQHGTVVHALEGRQQLPGFSPLPAEMMLARQSHTGEADSFIPRAVVHRLDRGTTGLMLIAKTPDAEMHLTQQFKGRTTRKRYVAILAGRPRTAAAGGGGGGRIFVDLPLDRDPARPGKMVAVAPGLGKHAQSVVHLHGYNAAGDIALVTVELLTGRQHQIRVHCASLGAPLANDDDYCGADRVRAFRAKHALSRGRPMLHAWSIEVAHPDLSRAAPLAMRAPLPPDMRDLVASTWPDLSMDPSVWPDLRLDANDERDALAPARSGPGNTNSNRVRAPGGPQ